MPFTFFILRAVISEIYNIQSSVGGRGVVAAYLLNYQSAFLLYEKAQTTLVKEKDPHAGCPKNTWKVFKVL